MEDDKLSAATLKDQLWNTLRGVRDGSTTVQQANAIATASREIVRVARLQIMVSEAAKRDVSADLVTFAER